MELRARPSDFQWRPVEGGRQLHAVNFGTAMCGKRPKYPKRWEMRITDVEKRCKRCMSRMADLMANG